MERSPLALHFVWIGPRLPYFARLAVESALVAMPDVEVYVHYVGRAAAGIHAERLAAYPRVRVQAGPLGKYFEGCPPGRRALCDVLARIPDGSPAAISNLVRLAVLWRSGGVYLDTDVLVLRALHDPGDVGAYVGLEQVWSRNRSRVESHSGLGGQVTQAVRATPWAARWLARRADARLFAGRLRVSTRLPERDARLQVNNAVVAAPVAAPFVAAALERACHVDPSKRFALGPSLLDDVVRAEPRLARLVPPSRFFAVPPAQSFRYFEDAELQVPVDAQLIHYVASNHRRLLAALTEHDRRIGSCPGMFWQHAAAVQRAVADGRACTAIDAALRRVG